ncbi:Uncharacterised protein [Acinetobacter baumannii]|nr:Uncharacterised protein [Acinetobacter baumannii]
MFALFKFCSSSLYSPQYSTNININNFLEFIRCDISNRLNLCNSSVINHDIKPTKSLLSMIYSSIHLLAVTDISNKCARIYT